MSKNFFCGIAILLGLGLALGGCDNKKEEAKSEDGHATLSVGDTKIQVKDENASGSIALPANMPAYAAVYPGADVRVVATMGEGTMITYVTGAKPDDVIAFHKKAAIEAGLKQAQEVRLSGGMWNYGAANGEKNLNVTLVAENGKHSVQIVYK